jgi:hypothetical protein
MAGVTHFYLLMHADLQRVPRVRAFFDFVVSEIRAFRVVLAGQSKKKTLPRIRNQNTS